jgi:transcriptional regulator with XRE-family HTH domain
MSKTIHTQDHKYIVKKLREARIEAGLSQKDVGVKMGKSQSYISKIESGQRRIDIVQLKMFTGLYGKKIKFFIKK